MSWYLIMVSWEMDDEIRAIHKFKNLYRYLSPLTPTDVKIDQKVKDWVGPIPELGGDDDPRRDIVDGSLKPLNLNGSRKFVIIFKIKPDRSHRIVTEISARISLNAPIKVEIFPATYVHDLVRVLAENTSSSE